jgi:hypothetical protein
MCDDLWVFIRPGTSYWFLVPLHNFCVTSLVPVHLRKQAKSFEVGSLTEQLLLRPVMG